jgi:medium-chain acyl-[acyl-carrier-protein] hydrolase
VEGIASQIAPHLATPFAFFGHSMGALVSFELLRRLRNNGEPRALAFFASGCAAPPLVVNRKGTYDLPEPEFIDELRSLKGTPEEVLADKELLHFVLPTLRADFQASQTYKFVAGKTLQCPIFAYGGLADSAVTREDLDPWRNETTATFVRRMFPGDHFYVHAATEMLTRSISADLFGLTTNYVPTI